MKQHYHFIGIGGIGMAALANLILDQGHSVSGSDVSGNQLIVKLIDRGANISIGHHADNVQSADLVIYSSAIKEHNVEFSQAKKLNKIILKRAQLLAQLSQNYDVIAVSGAHGKTTTTSMIAHMLTEEGLNPSTAVGGVMNNMTNLAQFGSGKQFVIEVDESDGSFLYFKQKIGIITNIDREHLDHYKDFETLKKAFCQFIENIDNDGLLIFNIDDELLSSLVANSNVEKISFGINTNGDLFAKDIVYLKFNTVFTLFYSNQQYNVNLQVPGSHNIYNALACIAVGLKLGIPIENAIQSLSTFSGVRRRFQIKADIDDILIIDDYAHHPTEIASVIKAARNFKQKLTVVFQPHRYSRLKDLYSEFVRCFEGVDKLYITQVYSAGESPIAGINEHVLVDAVSAFNQSNVEFIERDDITRKIMSELSKGDLVLFLGAGDIIKYSQEIAGELSKKCQI